MAKVKISATVEKPESVDSGEEKTKRTRNMRVDKNSFGEGQWGVIGTKIARARVNAEDALGIFSNLPSSVSEVLTAAIEKLNEAEIARQELMEEGFQLPENIKTLRPGRPEKIKIELHPGMNLRLSQQAIALFAGKFDSSDEFTFLSEEDNRIVTEHRKLGKVRMDKKFFITAE